ncbi:IS3 family transposase [Alistipes finegoldii]|uniref:IS3 family transposase n=1 Tax=Alistipes finegoldii TaxID=214856 RepID=UPI0012DCB6C1
MARSTFYYHFRKSKQPDKYAREKESIIRLYHEHKGRYGYRRITVEMNKIGYAINHKTVLKLMNICGIKSQVRLRKYCSYKRTDRTDSAQSSATRLCSRKTESEVGY